MYASSFSFALLLVSQRQLKLYPFQLGIRTLSLPYFLSSKNREGRMGRDKGKEWGIGGKNWER
jgi:hypothetical protein